MPPSKKEGAPLARYFLHTWNKKEFFFSSWREFSSAAPTIRPRPQRQSHMPVWYHVRLCALLLCLLHSMTCR